MPENAIYVGRPTRWGNPYPVTKHMPEETATHELMMSLDSYRTWLISKLRDEPHFLEPLRGKNLACWCRVGYCKTHRSTVSRTDIAICDKMLQSEHGWYDKKHRLHTRPRSMKPCEIVVEAQPCHANILLKLANKPVGRDP